MELTIREAATLLGISPRTVRDRLNRGTLTGRKRGGRWALPRHSLPLTEGQRDALHAKADALRDALEAALPAPARRGGAQRLRDLDVYRLGLALRTDAATDTASALDEGLHAVAEGHFAFQRAVKLDALRRARRHFARATSTAVLSGATGVADALESTLLPRLAGLIRWCEGLPA